MKNFKAKREKLKNKIECKNLSSIFVSQKVRKIDI
jgi:hypothetical protein